MKQKCWVRKADPGWWWETGCQRCGVVVCEDTTWSRAWLAAVQHAKDHSKLGLLVANDRHGWFG